MTTIYWRALAVVAGLNAFTVAQAGWSLVANSGPASRYQHAMAYDSQRGQSVLFGGSGSTILGDTWEWDGTTWVPRIFAAGPSARAGHAMAYDSLRGESVLFGGSSGTVILGDTWVWNGSHWTQISATGPVRSDHKMAYDSQRGRMVVFGGSSNGVILGDTWEWDGTSWAQVATNGPARQHPAMAYDSQRGRTVLFGGSLGLGTPTDTWEWDGTAWAQMATTGPVGRYGTAMVYDSQRGRTVLFGGQGVSSNPGNGTWEWDGTAWAQVATTGPLNLSFHAMAYDSQRGTAVLFGGGVGSPQGGTWELVFGVSSSAGTFGNGCGGPFLDLSPLANAGPVLGSTAQALLTNIPSSLAFVALGWSRTTFGSFGLPLTLSGYGMPGCELLQSSEFNVPAVATGPGTASYSLPLPSWSGLVGLHIYLQGWAVAPGVNPGNTIVSNGVEWVIGF